MATQPIALSKTTPEVKALLKATYPDYRGRTIKLEVQDTYYMHDYWTGGSRTYVKAFDLGTGKIAGHNADNPFERQAHASFPIPDGVAMVEHVIFCGKDCGIRVIVNTATAPKALAAGREG